MNTILSRIFTPAFFITLARYALASAGVWLVSRGLIDEGTWEVVGGAMLTIVVALLGGADAVKDKAVIDGKSVSVSKLPASVQGPLEAAVTAAKARGLWAMLFGK